MNRWDEFNWRRFEPSRPRAAKGGIKAHSKRGAFAQSWWAKRWLAALEGFNLAARLQRGRSYARSGQVLTIEIDKGLVTAEVQGSRPDPYAVRIEVKTLGPPAWKKLAKALSHQAIFSASLLAGKMPPEIEEAFQKSGLSLFPERSQDLKTECSCPDWSNPCKHIAAVYYLLGEEFDRDPFLIFKMRGMSREELVKLLGGSGWKQRAPAAGEEETAREEPLPKPVERDVSRFWMPGALPQDLYGDTANQTTTAALAKRLGGFPFWRGRQTLAEALEQSYRYAADRGLNLMAGEK